MSSDYIAHILMEKIPLNEEKAISDILSSLKASLILLTRNKWDISERFQHLLVMLNILKLYAMLYPSMLWQNKSQQKTIKGLKIKKIYKTNKNQGVLYWKDS